MDFSQLLAAFQPTGMSAQLPSSMSTPGLGQLAAGMPQMAPQRPGILQGLGGAMQGGDQPGAGVFGGNWAQPTGAGLSASHAQSPMMHSSGILQSLMQDDQGGGLQALLMHLLGRS